jgi:hypothetical protein
MNPCSGSCGYHAICHVINHTPVCTCEPGFIGDPFVGCNSQPGNDDFIVKNNVYFFNDGYIVVARPVEVVTPCDPSPCGTNAICKVQNKAGACSCLPEYHGDPYVECRPECVLNDDCPRNKACLNNKCRDPCPGVCGINAECFVYNHAPSCCCLTGHTGNPLQSCRVIPSMR